MELKDAACLITGGTRGIGAATAIALAEHGANIVIVGRRIDETASDVVRQEHRTAHVSQAMRALLKAAM